MDTSLPTVAPEADPAAQAFARLAEKVDLLEAAIAGLAAKRESAPDYSETLGEIASRLERIREGINTLARRPAMQLTPDTMAEKIEKAGERARVQDSATITQAQQRIDKAAGRIERLTGTIATIHEQNRRLIWAVSVGVLAGMLLWSFLPGVVARAAPESWLWPERIAARQVGKTTIWAAGERMLEKADPEHWRAVLLANRILQDNRRDVAACLEDAKQTGRPKRCTVIVGQPQP